MKKYLLGIGLVSLGLTISSCNKAAEEEPEYGGDSEIDNSGINQSDDNNLDEPEETDD